MPGVNPNDIPTPGGNFNDQSIPGLDGVADPISVERLCLRSDYWGSDGEQIVVGDRVSHPVYGPGAVYSYCGESTVLKYVLVNFDSGKQQRVSPGTLSHV